MCDSAWASPSLDLGTVRCQRTQGLTFGSQTECHPGCLGGASLLLLYLATRCHTGVSLWCSTTSLPLAA